MGARGREVVRDFCPVAWGSSDGGVAETGRARPLLRARPVDTLDGAWHVPRKEVLRVGDAVRPMGATIRLTSSVAQREA